MAAGGDVGEVMETCRDFRVLAIEVAAQFRYWRDGSTDDLDAARALFTANKVRQVDFFLHLALEKALRLRGVWVFMPEQDDFIGPDELNQSPFGFRRTRVFKPRHVADRIRAQGGWFTLHHPTKDNRFVPLNKNRRYKEKLRCIPVNDNWRIKFLQDLDRCGVTDYTVFPDLGGLTSRLNRDMKIKE